MDSPFYNTYLVIFTEEKHTLLSKQTIRFESIVFVHLACYK